MQRIPCRERDDWQATAEACGFDFHTIDGVRYWDERAFYAFTLAEIEDLIEAPTGEIDAMCRELCGSVVEDERHLKRLRIPEAFWPLIRDSWRRTRPMIGEGRGRRGATSSSWRSGTSHARTSVWS